MRVELLEYNGNSVVKSHSSYTDDMARLSLSAQFYLQIDQSLVLYSDCNARLEYNKNRVVAFDNIATKH